MLNQGGYGTPPGVLGSEAGKSSEVGRAAATRQAGVVAEGEAEG